MKLFHVPAGVRCRVIPDGQEMWPRNLRPHVTLKDSYFELEEMIIDPTGVSKHCAGPEGVTIGSSIAKAGYYGFKREKWVIIVDREHVTLLA